MVRSAKRRREARIAEIGRPLRVLLLGRTKKRLDGGLARSVRMISDALRWCGNEVTLADCNAAPADGDAEGMDVVWHYGDHTHIAAHRAEAERAGVPFLVNSEFDGDWLETMPDTMRNTSDVLVVFTQQARDTLLKQWKIMGGHDGKRRVIVLPKTIRPSVMAATSVHGREGICIGELAKLRRPKLLGGWCVEEVVDALRAVLPSEPIMTYGQYTTAEHVPFEHTENVPKPGERMLGWLAKRKLCVCLTSAETFSMVPAEAQAVGTPVVYRSMPQSLNEHIGHTGVCVASPKELAVAAARLISSHGVWSDYGYMGTSNHLARGVPMVGNALDMSIRLFVFGGE